MPIYTPSSTRSLTLTMLGALMHHFGDKFATRHRRPNNGPPSNLILTPRTPSPSNPPFFLLTPTRRSLLVSLAPVPPSSVSSGSSPPPYPPPPPSAALTRLRWGARRASPAPPSPLISDSFCRRIRHPLPPLPRANPTSSQRRKAGCPHSSPPPSIPLPSVSGEPPRPRPGPTASSTARALSRPTTIPTAWPAYLPRPAGSF
jgi:hypothetical protein